MFVLGRATFGVGLILAVVGPLRAGDADSLNRETTQAVEALKKAGAKLYPRNGEPTTAMILKEIDQPTLALLGKLDQLASLTLAGDWVTDARLEELRPVLTHVEFLDVRGRRVSDQGLAAISGLRALKRLTLAQVAITDEGLAPLAQLSSLETLYLTDTPITGAGLRHLQHLPRLREIALDGNRLKDFELAQLDGLASLKILEVHEGISDRAVAYLKQLKGLRRVLLHRTNITDAGVDELRRALPSAEIIGGSLAASQKKMSQLGLAVHEYHSQHGHFPPAVLTGPDGKTPYSWRVALLPLLGRNDLYSQYHQDQPWDSEANRKVLKQMPDVYRAPHAAADSHETAYLAVTGPNSAFADKEGTTIRQLADGTSNVVMLVEARSSIPWTKPEDLSREDRTLPKLAAFYHDGFNALMADGYPRFYRVPFKNEEELGAIVRQSAFALYEQEIRREMVGKPAPNFTLKDLSGHDVTLAPLIAGKVAVLVFTGVRCPPCRAEAPHLAEIYHRHQHEGLVMLAVNLMDEPAEMVRKFADKEHTPFPTLLQGRSVGSDDYRVVVSPTVFFINREGIIVGAHFGFRPGDERNLESEAAELLSGRGRSLH
jgi:peroxiredoxin